MDLLMATHLSGIKNPFQNLPIHHPAGRTNPYFDLLKNERSGAGKNVFLCYAKSDEAWQRRLSAHLSPLRQNGQIGDWSEGAVLPEPTMSEGLKERFHKADIILLLFSPDFIAISSAWDADGKTIVIERHEKGEAVVLPVILEPCLWEETIFGGFQPLPKGGVPISGWDDPEQGFNEVAEEVKGLL